MIRAVVVDVGGVLTHDGSWDDLDARWAARLGLDPVEWDRRATVDPEGLHLVGEVAEAEMLRRWREALGLDDAALADLRRDVWDCSCGTPDPVMIDFVRSLRPRLTTGICSNSMDGARREEARRFGFDRLVDDLVYSHEVGLAKPDPAIYELVCARLGVAATEVAFVDDREVNVAAARELGMSAVLHRDAATTIRTIRGCLR